MLKNINFKENELEELIEYYQYEYDKTKQQAAILRSLLKKLKQTNGSESDLQKINEPEKQQHRKTPDENTNKDQNMKTTDKNNELTKPITETKPEQAEPNEQEEQDEASFDIDLSRLSWDQFIENAVNNQNEVIAENDIIELAITGYGLNGIDPQKVTDVILPALENLCNQDTLKRVYFPNYEEPFYGNSKWFNSDDTIYEKYIPEDIVLPEESEEEQVKEESDDDDFYYGVENTPKSELENFIVNTLGELKQLTPQNTLAEKIYENFNVTEDEKQFYKLHIDMAVEKLIRRQEILTSESEEGENRIFALTEWFNEKGELIL